MAKSFVYVLLALLIVISFSANISAEAICQYASSASATSQNTAGSLASYATGAPNAPNVGTCTDWSGYGYIWSPANWDIKANLTLKYNKIINVTNFTISGDYDMCWSKMWLKNSATGQQKAVFSGYDENCVSTKTLDGSFLADTMILETCGWGWSSTDAVQMCGINSSLSNSSSICGNSILETGEECDDGNVINSDGCSNVCKIEIFINLVKICDWQNCTKGAASISVDDSETSCMTELNAHGFKGTYFLIATNKFSQSTWNFWNSSYKNGHELGCHTQTHFCSQVSDTTLRSELSSNINDIITHIQVPAGEIVSFAWPCGFNTDHEKQIVSEYFLGSRGYFINQLEDKNPADFMNLKSYNTPDYNGPPYDPPSYLLVADQAESQGKWANFVFHNSCNDNGAIDYLATKSIWVAPIGTITKYIIERQNAKISNLNQTANFISFDIRDNLNHTLYNKNLSLEVNNGNNNISSLTINGATKPFYLFKKNNTNYLRFNLLPSGNDHVELFYLQLDKCVDTDKDGYYYISAGCLAGNDCNDNNSAINPGASEKQCNGIDNDCDLLIDEDYVVNNTNCGVGACKSTGQSTCSNGTETNSCVPKLPLSVNDSTCDGIDDNCNSKIDEDCIVNYLCQYASSASATSQNTAGSLASYATGAPNAPNVGTCTDWSGYGYTWSPANWNIKANLTLSYATKVNVTNFTIFGDYDMCFDAIWLKNNATGKQTQVFSGTEETCTLNKTLSNGFLADTIILQICGWSWSSTDSVRLCGEI